MFSTREWRGGIEIIPPTQLFVVGRGSDGIRFKT